MATKHSAVQRLLARTISQNCAGRSLLAGVRSSSCRQTPHCFHPHPLSASTTTITRSYASTTVEGSAPNKRAETSRGDNNNNNSKSSAYVSPFQEIFDTIQQGKTYLGTTEFQIPETKLLKCGIPEHVLKFKTTAYGRFLEAPYVRPMEHCVTLQVAMRHIPLTEVERLVLKEIVGTRLNDETGVLQLTSSQFGSRIENKRHVVSMLERAVESAKVLAARVEEEAKAEA
mmetsp:Transcript_4003/g.6303  ORF Transcript_4003/g.6303 Transcript_4003/m.6303 type:complete len:229 (-) Transcript_4003:64-750(-)